MSQNFKFPKLAYNVSGYITFETSHNLTVHARTYTICTLWYLNK